MSYGIVYVITNEENGLVYIGATKHDLTKRWRTHLSTAKAGGRTPITKAIHKFGPEAFSIMKIGEANSPEELDEMERSLIREFQADDPACGYNVTSGGRKGFKVSPDIVAKSIAKGLVTKSLEPKVPKIPIPFRVTTDIHEALRRYAHIERETVTQVVRKMVRDGLTKKGYWPLKAKVGPLAERKEG